MIVYLTHHILTASESPLTLVSGPVFGSARLAESFVKRLVCDEIQRSEGEGCDQSLSWGNAADGIRELVWDISDLSCVVVATVRSVAVIDEELFFSVAPKPRGKAVKVKVDPSPQGCGDSATPCGKPESMHGTYCPTYGISRPSDDQFGADPEDLMEQYRHLVELGEPGHDCRHAPCRRTRKP